MRLSGTGNLNLERLKAMTNAQQKAAVNPLQHFNSAVPENLAAKLLTLAQAVENDFIGDQGFGGSYGCARLDDIHGREVSGFIPFQLGGFEVSGFYRSDIDSSYHFTKEQTAAMREHEKHMYECFARDHDLKDLPENWGYDDLPEELQNRFLDYENDWFEPALLRFEIWVDDPKAPLRIDQHGKKAGKVFARLSLAYSDAPYYRSAKDDETLFKFEMTAEEAMAIEPDAFVKRLETELAKVK